MNGWSKTAAASNGSVSNVVVAFQAHHIRWSVSVPREVSMNGAARPNLFSLATKELSQDAFIAWLLQWADPRCRDHNLELQAVAESFLRELISLQSEVPDSIQRVEAGRQWENIDVWAEVNNSHLIIIEDKVGTGQHSDQLSRYRATGEKWCQERSCNLVCVYIKTHSDSALNLQNVERQGFAVLNRKRLLEVLNAHEVKSDIYSDFRDRLQELERLESSFDKKKISEWNGNDWKGLYQSLEQRRTVVNWGYVNNPSGGFWNLILNWFDHDGVCPYMQIEQGNLCFKVGEVYESRGDVRHRFHRLLMDASLPEMGLARPGRFGSGTYMTVAVVPRQVWLGADDQIIDIDLVVARLNQYESWLKRTIEEAQQDVHGNTH